MQMIITQSVNNNKQKAIVYMSIMWKIWYKYSEYQKKIKFGKQLCCYKGM